MADILFVRKMPLRVFFFRRFSRVYPVLLLFVFINAAVFCSTPLTPGVVGVLSALSFTLNYLIIDSGSFIPVFDHIWSLCVEEHGYVLLGLLACLFRGANHRFIGLLILGLGFAAIADGILQYDGYGQNPFTVFWPSHVAVAPILISAALFLLLGQYRYRPAMEWLVPLAFFCGLAARLFADAAWLFFGAKIMLLALAVCMIERAARFSAILFEGVIFRQVGRMSFSIYLWQQPFYILARQGLLSQVLALVLAMCFGLLSYYLIEHPSRTRLNAWFEKSKQQGAALKIG
ncbi:MULTISPECIES: acyltransferase family protein [unclassified Rhizobium]|uniref:acyltransferase family protein n=1 Tax=unclassified Rhizobium TaxID=2613769 RepID=UPI001845055A|nr:MULTISPECIES: acyltransferase family protein [unclassified Rhizobium]MBB3285235.1 peptidoglycan/LPS O-acetylase OafA/YrhL [Rhizobium sp. BK252]MBB3399974.1 peptidoglycan/LPS O-acetylase OafA/YrhL [Rhizobium sp. BK289]MBB3412554.1 peptidoglycan/LPS O-acetylase OafA/YrhL [Rhizobium sp. BK284]MBB3480440.1 peptidoglycan/LPS O-acetylase OafA/YrhL [Rhizobium sp. BK347]MDK4719113.1 acyltransferase family protein [Rhizobium sp. CNPSo 3968]